MKVYVTPQDWMGKGIKRVARALAKHVPDGVKVVGSPADADLVLYHVVGWGSLPPDYADKPFAVMQYCFQSTEDANPGRWLEVWSKAKAVWSYYDLPNRSSFNFYRRPLGVDSAVFHARPVPRQWMIATHGHVAETEGVIECHAAARMLFRRGVHLGPIHAAGGAWTSRDDLGDDGVATLWSASERVAALRRCEGFELPAYEGLLCGARPVAFEQPHYRDWLGEHADYVPEVDATELVYHLRDLFARPVRPVTEAERALIADLCDWSRLAAEFWSMIL